MKRPSPGSPLLEGLEGEDLQRFVERLERRTFAAGDVLFKEHDPGDRLCLLARSPWKSAFSPAQIVGFAW